MLNAAYAIIMGSPTYMGTVSWQFKKFADASSKPWFSQQWKDKVFAGFTNSATMNGDKHSTLHYLITLAMQHSGIWVGTGMMPSSAKAAQRNDGNYLGSFGGAIAQSPSDSSPEEMLPGDLETAKLFGKRVAAVTTEFKSNPPAWAGSEKLNMEPGGDLARCGRQSSKTWVAGQTELESLVTGGLLGTHDQIVRL